MAALSPCERVVFAIRLGAVIHARLVAHSVAERTGRVRAFDWVETLFAHFAMFPLALRAAYRAFRLGHALARLARCWVSDQASELSIVYLTFASRCA